MPTTVIAGREYNVITHQRTRSVPVIGEDGKPKLTWKRTGTRGQRKQVVQKAGKLMFAGIQLERLDKKDRTISGRQRRMARKLAQRGQAK
jgi:hypothetical protein